MIKRSKNNENKPDFEDMMKEVDGELEEQQAKQEIVDRVPELKELSNNIDKATTTYINSVLQLESAIQQYQRAEVKLSEMITTISNKVDTINQHIDNVQENAPTKLKVSVSVSDPDMKKIQDMFDEEHRWVMAQMQKTLRDVNDMFIAERRRTTERYKEYDGCYLGHYAQWFFWFFCILGMVIVVLAIFLSLDSHYHWTK